MNDKEFREHLAELLARQGKPDQPAKKTPPTPEPTSNPATMSNKEFRQHLKQVVARHRNEDQQRVEKKPPKSESSMRLPAVNEKKPPERKSGQLPKPENSTCAEKRNEVPFSYVFGDDRPQTLAR